MRLRQCEADGQGTRIGQRLPDFRALVKTLATFDNRARELLVALEPVPPQISAGDFAWLESAEGNRFDVRHLRLSYVRALVESREYDEALRWMQNLEPHDVICPEILLFQRAVVHHQLVHADGALDAIEELVRCESPMPTRISRLALIMRADLESLEPDTLDHIGRRMRDVERRLQIGRANRQTTQVEESIIASLDKLIKEAEEEQQRQMQNQHSAQNQPPPSGKAMEDSRIAELKGAGKVDPRRLGEETQWGNLPPHERERIMQQLGRDFPAHYREVVEEYFRRLASEKEAPAERP